MTSGMRCCTLKPAKLPNREAALGANTVGGARGSIVVIEGITWGVTASTRVQIVMTT